MNIDNPKLIKQLESLVDNRQDWLFRFAYIRIGQREDAEDIVQEVLLRSFQETERRATSGRVGPLHHSLC